MSNTTQKTQVVIAGAGPTGLSLAAQLIRYNIDFIILEKNEHTTPLSKAVVVQARSLEIFKELGIVETAIQRGQVTTALNLFYKGKQRAFVDINGLGNGVSEFPFALSLEQSKTETLLAEYVTKHNKQINWQCAFECFEQNEKGVTVFYKDANGTEQKIEADYLVGCDGASSPIRHQMGATFEGDTVPKLFYVADVILKSTIINKNELFIFLIKKGFIIFFPMEGKGHYRVIGILPDVTDVEHHFEFEEIRKFVVEQVSVPLEFEKLTWFSTYKVHSRKANDFMKGRAFICGDAAHIHTPAGGQGMNTGIQDAYNLAWKLAACLKGDAGAPLLDTYNSERTQNARHLLQTTDRMFDVMTGANAILNFFRLSFFPVFARIITNSVFAKKRIFPLVSQTGIAYPDSALTIASAIGKIKAGDRMPYFIFKDKSSSYDHLQDPSFKLLFFSRTQNLPTLKETKIKFSAQHFKEIPENSFGKEDNFFVLLRPDNHVSYIGKDLNSVYVLLHKFSA